MVLHRTLLSALAGCALLAAPITVGAQTDPVSPAEYLPVSNWTDFQSFSALSTPQRDHLRGTVSAAQKSGHPVLTSCFAPGTDEQVVRVFREVEAGLRSTAKQARATGWERTATQPDGVPADGPVILTWSIMPDGASIVDSASGKDQVNILSAIFDAQYGSREAWVQELQRSLDSWSEVTNVTYVYEPNDDGVPLSVLQSDASAGIGIAGVRGDVRIGGVNIDGARGILAYNYYPTAAGFGGDMVLDISDLSFFGDRGYLFSIVAHEAGHGIGLEHSCPVVGTKLMEPFIGSPEFPPQIDDAVEINRLYGDVTEPNDDPASAPVLMAPVAGGVVRTPLLFAKESGDSDLTILRVQSAGTYFLELNPQGLSYLVSTQAQCASGVDVEPRLYADLNLTLSTLDGKAILGESTLDSPGAIETIDGLEIDAPGDYLISVTAASHTGMPAPYLLRIAEGSSDVFESGHLILDASLNATIQVDEPSDYQFEVSNPGSTDLSDVEVTLAGPFNTTNEAIARLIVEDASFASESGVVPSEYDIAGESLIFRYDLIPAGESTSTTLTLRGLKSSEGASIASISGRVRKQAAEGVDYLDLAPEDTFLSTRFRIEAPTRDVMVQDGGTTGDTVEYNQPFGAYLVLVNDDPSTVSQLGFVLTIAENVIFDNFSFTATVDADPPRVYTGTTTVGEGGLRSQVTIPEFYPGEVATIEVAGAGEPVDLSDAGFAGDLVLTLPPSEGELEPTRYPSELFSFDWLPIPFNLTASITDGQTTAEFLQPLSYTIHVANEDEREFQGEFVAFFDLPPGYYPARVAYYTTEASDEVEVRYHPDLAKGEIIATNLAAGHGIRVDVDGILFNDDEDELLRARVHFSGLGKFNLDHLSEMDLMDNDTAVGRYYEAYLDREEFASFTDVVAGGPNTTASDVGTTYVLVDPVGVPVDSPSGGGFVVTPWGEFDNYLTISADETTSLAVEAPPTGSPYLSPDHTLATWVLGNSFAGDGYKPFLTPFALDAEGVNRPLYSLGFYEDGGTFYLTAGVDTMGPFSSGEYSAIAVEQDVWYLVVVEYTAARAASKEPARIRFTVDPGYETQQSAEFTIPRESAAAAIEPRFTSLLIGQGLGNNTFGEFEAVIDNVVVWDGNSHLGINQTRDAARDLDPVDALVQVEITATGELVPFDTPESPVYLQRSGDGQPATISLTMSSVGTDPLDLARHHLRGDFQTSLQEVGPYPDFSTSGTLTFTITSNRTKPGISQGYIDLVTNDLGNPTQRIYLLDVVDPIEGPEAVDTDGDGLSDDDEINIHGTDPNRRDSDGDGAEDGIEIVSETDPRFPEPYYGSDADNDGLPDVIDLFPIDADRDGDGFLDGYEFSMGSDPNSPTSFPVLGDVNGDGAFDETDAEILYQGFLTVSGGNTSLIRGDLNRDGRINNLDAVILYQWIIGTQDTLPLH